MGHGCMEINRYNVGKIAERIVMNELEAHGYGATDLNKDRLAANADVLAAKDGHVWQVQVRGATNKPDENWWVQYGYCTDEMIQKKGSVFNRKQSAYTADYVAFVAVKSPSNYRCFVLPVHDAEKLAQINLDRYYRQPRKRDGGRRKAGKMWVHPEPRPRERRQDKKLDAERGLLKNSEGSWSLK